MKPQLILEQKITPLVNCYNVFSVQPDGSKGQLKAQAQQKRIAFKEKVTFYSDESRQQVVFTFRAEKVIDVHGRYMVEDPSGALIGSFKKRFGSSLLRSTWEILDTAGAPVYTVTESNAVLAVMRRFIGWVPIVGELYEIIILFFRYHFTFLDTEGKEKGKYTKTTLFRDHYRLEADDSLSEAVDWRVLAAMAVALDALQSR